MPYCEQCTKPIETGTLCRPCGGERPTVPGIIEKVQRTLSERLLNNPITLPTGCDPKPPEILNAQYGFGETIENRINRQLDVLSRVDGENAVPTLFQVVRELLGIIKDLGKEMQYPRFTLNPNIGNDDHIDIYPKVDWTYTTTTSNGPIRIT